MSWLVKLGLDTLEILFAAGMAGSLLVLILSAVEDFETLTNRAAED